MRVRPVCVAQPASKGWGFSPPDTDHFTDNGTARIACTRAEDNFSIAGRTRKAPALRTGLGYRIQCDAAMRTLLKCRQLLWTSEISRT